MPPLIMSADPPEAPGFPPIIPTPETLQALHQVMVRCTRCSLFMNRTQVVPGYGPANARVLLVGEAPGRSEDEVGIPFVGRSGLLLTTMLAEAGLSRDEVFVANVVRCRPPENRNPKRVEIRACAGWLREQLRLISPDLAITLGRFALHHFLPAGRITELQGELQKVDAAGRTLPLYPLFHPAAVLRNPKLRSTYIDQFRRIPEILKSTHT